MMPFKTTTDHAAACVDDDKEWRRSGADAGGLTAVRIIVLLWVDVAATLPAAQCAGERTVSNGVLNSIPCMPLVLFAHKNNFTVSPSHNHTRAI